MNPNGPNGTIFGKNDPTRLFPKNLFLAIGNGMSSVFWKDSLGAVNGKSELLLYSEKKSYVLNEGIGTWYYLTINDWRRLDPFLLI